MSNIEARRACIEKLMSITIFKNHADSFADSCLSKYTTR